MSNHMTPGDTIETSTWRVLRGALSIRVTHITNAGKRGKRCAEYTLYLESCGSDAALDPITEIVRAKAEREVDPAEMLVVMTMCKSNAIGLQVSELRGVDVTKPGEKVEIIGRAVKVRASTQGFAVANRLDVMNEETMIQVDRSGPVKVLAWVKANVKALESMTFADVTEALRSMGVNYHYHCAID